MEELVFEHESVEAASATPVNKSTLDRGERGTLVARDRLCPFEYALQEVSVGHYVIEQAKPQRFARFYRFSCHQHACGA